MLDKLISFFTTFYKDPLFSIIIILSIIILVAIADFTRNRFKNRQKEHSLKALAENFNFYELDKHLNDALHFSKTPKETLIIIAQIYVKSGNFDDAIKIYLAILDRLSDLKAKIEIFELLGIAYYKAGFMQRAKGIFIEILKHNPRSENALMLLMQTYETMGDYNSALEVISCLEEVRGVEHFRAVKTYIKMLILINDSLMSASVREREITKLMPQGAKKLALQYFLSQNQALFWEVILTCRDTKNYIDLLWNTPLPSEIQNKILESTLDSAQSAESVKNQSREAQPLASSGEGEGVVREGEGSDFAIRKNPCIQAPAPSLKENARDKKGDSNADLSAQARGKKEILRASAQNDNLSGFAESTKQIADIYRTKGVICDEVACDDFELETLRLVRKYGKIRADLNFKYKCKSCQSIFPFDSYRCPTCDEVGEMSVVAEIMELKQ